MLSLHDVTGWVGQFVPVPASRASSELLASIPLQIESQSLRAGAADSGAPLAWDSPLACQNNWLGLITAERSREGRFSRHLHPYFVGWT